MEDIPVVLFGYCLSFSLQWKSDESSKHYLTQMLLAINWRYWWAGKNSCVLMFKIVSYKCASLKSTKLFAKKKKKILTDPVKAIYCFIYEMLCFSDLERVREGIGSKCSIVIQYLSTFMSGICVGLMVNTRLTLMVLLFGPLVIAASAFMAKVCSAL